MPSSCARHPHNYRQHCRWCNPAGTKRVSKEDKAVAKSHQEMEAALKDLRREITEMTEIEKRALQLVISSPMDRELIFGQIEANLRQGGIVIIRRQVLIARNDRTAEEELDTK